MPETRSSERPLGVYWVALYFVLAGFLEAIQKYRDWNAPLTFNPLSEHSIWELAFHASVHLALAFLVWHYAALGRVAALVYGYAFFATYAGMAIAFAFYEGSKPLTVTPLTLSIAVFHVTALIPVIAYLQPKRRKKLFHVRLLDLLLPGD